MRSPGALPRNVALVVVFCSALAWFLAEQTFTLSPAQEASLRGTLTATALLELLFDAFVAWHFAGAIRRASAARLAGRDAEASTAAAAAMRIPFRLSAVVLGASACMTAVTVLAVRDAGVPHAHVLAGAGLGLACALLASLLSYSIASSWVAEELERLGVVLPAARSGSVRGKILALGLGLNTIALLLHAASTHGDGDAFYVVGIAGYVAAALLAWVAARAITLPIRTLGRAADRIASGDLTASAPSLSHDEMGRLASDFRRMAHGLKGLVGDVQAASAGVSTGAREATGIGERVRAGALEQHDGVQAVQGAVHAMEGSMALVSRGVGGLSAYISAAKSELGEFASSSDELRRKGKELDRAMQAALHDVDGLASAGRVADGTLRELESLAGHAGGTLSSARSSLAGLERAAGEAEANAAAVDELAAQVGDVVRETAQGIEAVRSAVADAHRRVNALGRRSDDVFQIVDFISEVAGRTNLLSLNASIIASQAGDEHGKAFAVVADQIRELAVQIARSTKSIGDIIHAVRADVAATVSLIDRGDALAADGVRLARNSADALGRIQRSTRTGRDTAASIRAAVEGHADSSRDVSRLVESVAEGSHAVSGAVQLVARSVTAVGSVSRGVNALADELSRALEDQGGHGARQVDRLAALERMISESARAVQVHDAATHRVREMLQALSSTTETHESAVQGLAGVADELNARARALADRVNRFKV